MKILVRGANWIGDAVMSVPALRELRRIFPDAHITLHTRSWADALFAEVDFIDELVTFDKTRWKIKDVYDNSEFLKSDGYDIAILLPNSFESALTSYLSRIPRRFGYNKDVRGLLLTDPIAVPEWKNRKHEVFYYLNLIGEIERRLLERDTISNAVPDISIHIGEDRRAAARNSLAAAGADLSKPLIALGVGSANSRAKRWPAARYAQLSDLLYSEIGANVVLVGSKDDAEIADTVVRACTTTPLNLTGRTSIGEAAAILSVVDLLIANDMGLAHLAPAVGTDTLVIFGPTNPDTTAPYSIHAQVIRKEVECSRCMLRDCPIDHRCMTGISVDEVLQAAVHRIGHNEVLEI
jgi:heptosyltransferase-2